MLLHLGEDRTVSLDRVEALFDFGLFARLPANRDFLEMARSEKRLLQVSTLPAKTVVVAGEKVFLSPLSRATLARRSALGPAGLGALHRASGQMDGPSSDKSPAIRGIRRPGSP